MEARAWLAETQAVRPPRFVGRDPVQRRKALKKLSYRLPSRPLLVFLYLYLLRGGLLDGGLGSPTAGCAPSTNS